MGDAEKTDPLVEDRSSDAEVIEVEAAHVPADDAATDTPSTAADATEDVAGAPVEAADTEDTTGRELTHAEQLLGPNVRSPVGVPKAYNPTDVSTHELLRIDIDDFGGPLDLLLFLIRKHDLDVFDIPIAFITDKYLEMLDSMTALPIDVAAEFLVMAAELTHIKSKMLLPPKEGIPVGEDEEDEGDPRADLVRRLLEYQKYRDAATDIGDRDRLGRDTFARTPHDVEADENFDPGLKEVSIFKLVETMAEVLARLEPQAQHEVTPDTLNVTDRTMYILEFAKKHGDKFTFKSLLAEARTRQVVVMTFLAILEMARTGVIKIIQDFIEDPAASEADGPPQAAAGSDDRPALDDAVALDDDAAPDGPAIDTDALVEGESEPAGVEGADDVAGGADDAAGGAECVAAAVPDVVRPPDPPEPNAPEIFIVMTGKAPPADLVRFEEPEG